MTRGADPIALMKAVKNPVEIEGARAAHRRDGAAVTRFLAWLDREAPSGAARPRSPRSRRWKRFRRDTGALKDVSFPTISGAGPNGAIVHYRVTRATNRTHHAGRAVPDRFRRPVPGRHHRHHPHRRGRRADAGDARALHAGAEGPYRASPRAVFPDGTTRRAARSVRARARCGQHGLDFDHGTGHGVGSYLSVHEGPPRISKLGNTPLKRGMILSNEPGYYKTGAYGIRIENLVLVIEAPAVAGGEKPLNAFETLTLAPIDRRLIEHVAADAPTRSPGSTPTTPGSPRRWRRWSMPRRGPGSTPRPGRSARTEASRGRHHRQARTTIRAIEAAHAMGPAAAADGDDRDRPDLAQHPGAGAAGAGAPVRRPTSPPSSSRSRCILLGARGRAARDGAAVRPVRPPPGDARRARAHRRPPACSPIVDADGRRA